MLGFHAQAGVRTSSVNLFNESTQTTKLDYQSLFYNFGYVPVHSFNATRVYIRNNGLVPMQYSFSQTWGFEFNSNHNCYSGLNPGQSCVMEITYWPNTVGFHNGDSTIQFRSSQAPYTVSDLRVNLTGQAFR